MSEELNLDALHNDDDAQEGTQEGTQFTSEVNAESTEGTEKTAEGQSASETSASNEKDSQSDQTSSDRSQIGAEGESQVDDNTPGIEQFLSKYGIVGGMINFEDGEAKHFNELTESEKFNILQDLSATSSPDIESRYGLDEEEIGLINWLRQQNQPLQQSIESLAQARVEQILAFNESNSTDFSSMADDAVMMRWLKESDPEASEEDLAEELTRQKESKLYEKNVNRLREQFTKQQEEINRTVELQQQEEFNNMLEEQRSTIVTVVQDINDIAGFKVSDEDKNNILHDLLETNEYGDSLFMEEVFSDPKTLFKAAWMYKNGEAYFDNLEQYYKKEIAKAYQNGKNEALNGMPSRPISGSINNNSNSGSSKEEPIRKENFVDLDDLHSDF